MISPANDDASVQCLREHLLDPDTEGIPVYRAFYQHRRIDPVAAPACDEAVVAPVAIQDRAVTGRAP